MIRSPANAMHAKPSLADPLLSKLLVGCALVLTVGCYSGEVLVDRVRNDALRLRQEEVDLGRYTVTMPRDPATTEIVEVEMRVFGSLARYQQADVQAQLEEKEFLLRHGALMAIRNSSLADFSEPDLTTLRTKLLAVANGLLEEPNLRKVGFHEIRFVRH